MLLVHRLPNLTLTSAIDPIKELVFFLKAATHGAGAQAAPSEKLVKLLTESKPWLLSTEPGRFKVKGIRDEALRFRFDRDLFALLRKNGPAASDWDYPNLLAYLFFEREDGSAIAFIDPDGRVSFYLTDDELSILRESLVIPDDRVIDFRDYLKGKMGEHEDDFYSLAIIQEYLEKRPSS